jgi:ribosomal protein S18 acetylase RimI-like enzyme
MPAFGQESCRRYPANPRPGRVGRQAWVQRRSGNSTRRTPWPTKACGWLRSRKARLRSAPATKRRPIARSKKSPCDWPHPRMAQPACSAPSSTRNLPVSWPIHPQREKLRHGIELAGMYVAVGFRRRGFGRALLDAAIFHGKSISGVRLIKLGVNATNVAAKALYRSAGFEIYGLEPDALRGDGVFHGEEHYALRIRPDA